MRATIDRWTADEGWRFKSGQDVDFDPELILCFASKRALAMDSLDTLIRRHPRALVAACSTGGEINGSEVSDDTASAAFMRFDHTEIISACADISGPGNSYAIGEDLARRLTRDDLRCVLILSDGLHVNGARLVEGLRAVLSDDVVIAGGLAGDGADFHETLVSFDGEPRSHHLVAIGLCGARLRLGSSSQGGWDSFGPERRITRSEGPIVYELDGKPALALYKKYLGDEADNLPSSALLFPLAIRCDETSIETLTRTIVAVDEETQSLTFAGEMPQGWIGQLMRGVTDRIVDGAARAAQAAQLNQSQGALGLMFSCIGRKLILGQRVHEEVEAVCAAWPGVATIGFYSYGEIGPHGATGRCTLHNQTMTALLLGEQ